MVAQADKHRPPLRDYVEKIVTHADNVAHNAYIIQVASIYRMQCITLPCQLYSIIYKIMQSDCVLIFHFYMAMQAHSYDKYYAKYIIKKVTYF